MRLGICKSLNLHPQTVPLCRKQQKRSIICCVSVSVSSPAKLVVTLAAAPGHDMPHHPETAARVTAIQQAIAAHGLDRHPRVELLHPQLGASGLSQLQDVLQLVHPLAYLQRLEEICSSLSAPTMIDDSTYIAPGSFVACCETAAAVLDVLDTVLTPSTLQMQQHQHGTMGFCLVRPPGHHVGPSKPMGFGLINFMAVSARYALQQPHINKVLVVDFDVHHGNGVNDIFEECPAVLYISTHQQELWPYTGKLTSIGTGAGKGYTINVPLPGDSGHNSMLAVWQQVIEPAAWRFQPDLILCSAGYDAHFMDPLAGLQFESRTYAYLCQRLAALAQELCDSRCMWILEGGYHIPSLTDAVTSSMNAILDGVLPEADSRVREEPMGKVQDLLDKVTKLHCL